MLEAQIRVSWARWFWHRLPMARACSANMTRAMLRLPAVLAAALLVATPALRADTLPPIIENSARILPVLAERGMVVAQEKRAAQIGVDVLKARRQCCRCRRRRRLRTRGHASARRQPWRRRLHARASCRSQRGCGARLSRDGARRNRCKHLPRRNGRGRSAQIARDRPRRRRARHGRRTLDRAGALGIGQIFARAIACPRHRSRPRRHRRRGRSRRLAVRRRIASRPLAVEPRDLLRRVRTACWSGTGCWCRAISHGRWSGSRGTVPTASIWEKRRKKSSPRCGPPAAA